MNVTIMCPFCRGEGLSSFLPGVPQNSLTCVTRLAVDFGAKGGKERTIRFNCSRSELPDLDGSLLHCLVTNSNKTGGSYDSFHGVLTYRWKMHLNLALLAGRCLDAESDAPGTALGIVSGNSKTGSILQSAASANPSFGSTSQR